MSNTGSRTSSTTVQLLRCYDTTSVLGFYYASNIVLEESIMQVSFGLTTLFLLLFLVLCFSLLSRYIFLWQMLSLYRRCRSSLLVLGFPVLSFFTFANSLMSSMYIRWLILYCDLWSLYRPVHFRNMWLSGIIAITNSNGDSASPWKIPLWIFPSAQLFHLSVNSTL